MKACIVTLKLIKKEFQKDLRRTREEDEVGKERHTEALKKVHKRRKGTISDRVLKHQFWTELELTKGLLTQYPNFGTGYKRGKNLPWEGSWRLQ